jgi:iron complex transport system ATP-binding protein
LAAAPDALEDDAMTPLLEAQMAVPGRLHPTHVIAQAGERIAVIGPNGSGKTSLLRALAGIEPVRRPGAGQWFGRSHSRLENPASVDTWVKLTGEFLQSMPPARRRSLMSFLPASREVSWAIPVRDVITLGLERQDTQRISDVLQALDLEAFSNRPIDSLSTGERARALLGRALAPRPKLLLLDEPLSNLDPAWALRILDVLDETAAVGAAVIVSLHDLSLIDRFDRVLMLDHGSVRFDGSPQGLVASAMFSEVFGIEADGAGWKLRR